MNCITVDSFDLEKDDINLGIPEDEIDKAMKDFREELMPSVRENVRRKARAIESSKEFIII